MGKLRRRNNTLAEVEKRKDKLCANFLSYLQEYERNPPFKKYGQLEFHDKTIKKRRELCTVRRTVFNDQFVENLRETLVAWGVNRGGRLVGPVELQNILRDHEMITMFEALERFHIDDQSLDETEIANRLWHMVQVLNVSTAQNKVVSGTKTLHHLLPDLVPPIDRKYTSVFFQWHSQFQNRPERVFKDIYRGFVEITRRSNPAQYVNGGWRTSKTKVVDNAIVAFCSQDGYRCSSGRFKSEEEKFEFKEWKRMKKDG